MQTKELTKRMPILNHNILQKSTFGFAIHHDIIFNHSKP